MDVNTHSAADESRSLQKPSESLGIGSANSHNGGQMMLVQLLLSALLFSAPSTSTNQYEGWVMASVDIGCPEDIQSMREIGARSLACYDHLGQTQMLMTEKMVKEARLLQISTKITERDILGKLEAIKRMRAEARSSGVGGWYGDFRSWEEVNTRLQQIAVGAPEIATVFSVGTTHEGRTIHGIRITAPGDAATRRRILFNGCQHAREWVALMVPMYIAEYLVNGWYTDPEIKSLFENVSV